MPEELTPAIPQTSGEENIPAAKRAYSHALLNLTVYSLASFLLTNLIVAILRKAGVYEGLSTNWKYIVSFAPMYLGAFPLYLLLSRNVEAVKPEEHRVGVGKLILCIFCCETIGIIGNYVGMFFNFVLSKLLGVKTSSDMIEEGVYGESGILFTVIAVAFAPIVEEMLFRKVLIDRTRKYGDGAAILLSGLLFGAFHGNFTQFFYTAGVGLFFAFVYVRTGRIRYTIFMHMGLNFLGTAVPLFFKDEYEKLMKLAADANFDEIMRTLTDLIPLLIYTALLWGVIITGFVLLLVFRKQFRLNTKPIAPLPKGKRLRTACLNLGFLSMMVVCIGEFVLQIMQNV